MLGLAVLMIPAAKIADQYGRKKVMVFGFALFGLSSALCGFSESLFFLIAMRFIQGIGGAIITPIVIPMALDIFGKEKNGQGCRDRRRRHRVGGGQRPAPWGACLSST